MDAPRPTTRPARIFPRRPESRKREAHSARAVPPLRLDALLERLAPVSAVDSAAESNVITASADSSGVASTASTQDAPSPTTALLAHLYANWDVSVAKAASNHPLPSREPSSSTVTGRSSTRTSWRSSTVRAFDGAASSVSDDECSYYCAPSRRTTHVVVTSAPARIRSSSAAVRLSPSSSPHHYHCGPVRWFSHARRIAARVSLPASTPLCPSCCDTPMSGVRPGQVALFGWWQACGAWVWHCSATRDDTERELHGMDFTTAWRYRAASTPPRFCGRLWLDLPPGAPLACHACGYREWQCPWASPDKATPRGESESDHNGSAWLVIEQRRSQFGLWCRRCDAFSTADPRARPADPPPRQRDRPVASATPAASATMTRADKKAKKRAKKEQKKAGIKEAKVTLQREPIRTVRKASGSPSRPLRAEEQPAANGAADRRLSARRQ